MKLLNRTLLVTGGASGIGRGLAQALVKRGNRVVIAGLDRVALAEAAGATGCSDFEAMDVRDPASIAAAVAAVLVRHPGLDGVVNCAGIMRDDDIGSGLDDEMLVDIMHTNLLGPMRVNAALLPHLLRQPLATIVNVSSMLGVLPLASSAIYSASKAALRSYTLSLRQRLRGSAVEVLDLAPPYVQTALMAINLHDPRAMPLPQFLDETLAVLQTDAVEVLVPRARQRLDALRRDEVAATAAFNAMMLETAPRQAG